MHHSPLLALALLSFTPLARAQDCAPPPDGMVAWWDADETYTSPGGNHDRYAMNLVNRISGVPLNINPVAIVPGHVGQGFEFPNNSGYATVALDSRLDFTTAMSVELWLRASPTPASQFSILAKCDTFGYFSSQDGYMLFGDFSTGKATFRVGHGSGGSAVTTTTNVTDGAWHHIAATFDASLAFDNLAIYVDGVLEATANAGSPIAVNTINLHMGAGIGTRTVDALSLYDRALTAPEVALIAQAGEKCSERFPSRPRDWTELAMPGATQAAGISLATESTVLAAGYWDNQGLDQVKMYVRNLGDRAWYLRQTIQVPGSFCTLSVTRSGHLLALGTGGAQSCCGGIYVFRYNPPPVSQWELEFWDSAAGSGDSVGIYSHSANPGVAILGRGSDLFAAFPPPEFARIYRYSGPGWAVDAQLDNPRGPAYTDGFALSVDIDDDLAVVGAPYYDAAGVGLDCGALYVYRYTAGTWTLVHTITPDMVDTTSPPNFDSWWFGRSVDLDGERVLVSAPYANLQGSAYGKAFVIDLTGGNVVVEGELRPSRETSAYYYGRRFGDDSPQSWSRPRGRGMHLVGDRAVVGASHDGDDLYAMGAYGAAYVFERRNGEWREVSKLAVGVPAPNVEEGFGKSPVISGDEVIGGVLDRLYVFAPWRPIADAGDDQVVDEGTVVTLDGSGSSDSNGDPLTYAWTQTGGSPVSLGDDATAATPSFTAPKVGPGGETLTFELVVDNGDSASAPDVVDVTVKNVRRIRRTP